MKKLGSLLDSEKSITLIMVGVFSYLLIPHVAIFINPKAEAIIWNSPISPIQFVLIIIAMVLLFFVLNSANIVRQTKESSSYIFTIGLIAGVFFVSLLLASAISIFCFDVSFEVLIAFKIETQLTVYLALFFTLLVVKLIARKAKQSD